MSMVVLEEMEANFMLKTKKQLSPLPRLFTKTSLNGMFLHKDKMLTKCIQRLMEESLGIVENHFTTNMDACSLIVSWVLELEHSLESVKRVASAIIPEDYSLNLASILKWAVPRRGFYLCEGIVNFCCLPEKNYTPFLR